MPRPSIYTQTFDPLQEGTRATGPSVDVAEVFHLVSWFRNILRHDKGGKRVSGPFWYHDEFLPIASNAIEGASRKMVGFCQKRVREVTRHSHDGEIEVVPLMRALEHLPQLRHKGHEYCTPEFCYNASKDYTSVIQLHKCHSQNCATTTDNMFSQELLVAALNNSSTAWKLDGMSFAQYRNYLAVSHVWADGTGDGTWKKGRVNQCLWDFWVDIARRLECDGVWWDAVCIPKDKAARSIALSNMHGNYERAKCTVVHDLYLAGIEWKNEESACIALALSTWFTRGWTALELFLSRRVFVLFRQGDGYILKDLDNEILAKHPVLDSHAHWIATSYVRHLRKKSFESTSTLLSVLRPRSTSWVRDELIIAGLMCGIKDHVELSEQQITKRIMRQLFRIDRVCLLHGQPTMSELQYSWCPTRFVNLPGTYDRHSDHLVIDDDGILSWKLWEAWLISKTHVDRGIIQPLSMDMGVQAQVQQALQKPEKHVILTCDSFDAQGFLVRPKADELHLKHRPIFCEYIGAVNVTPSAIRKIRDRCWVNINIGYKPGMVDVEVVDWLSI